MAEYTILTRGVCQYIFCQEQTCWGVRRFVPDEFVFGVLDYYFAVGVWGCCFRILGLGQVLGTNCHGFNLLIISNAPIECGILTFELTSSSIIEVPSDPYTTLIQKSDWLPQPRHSLLT